MANSLHPELLSALLDGQLSPEQKASVEEHLQNHPRDAAVYEDLQRLSMQLRGLPALAAPADFKQRVLQQIHESAAIPAIAALPSTQRSASNTVWLLACAASLAALLLAGVFYSLGQNNPRLIAEHDLAKTNSPGSADLQPAPQNAPSGSASKAKNDESFAKKEQPAPSAADGRSEESGKSIDRSEPVVESAQMPPAAAKAELLADSNMPSVDDAVVAEESQQETPAAADKIQNRGAFGGGAGGGLGSRAKVDADALAKDGAKSKNGVSDAPTGDVAEPTDSFVPLDQLIFVQIPPNQPAEEWIASVFRQAKVQVDTSDDPNSFTELIKERDSKKLAPAESDKRQALSATEKQESQDARGVVEKTQPELSPAPEYLKPDQTTTAYWVDADVEQIRTIMDRLDGAVIVGFSSNGNQRARGLERPQQKSYRGPLPLARRLPLLDVPPRSDDASKDKQPNRERDEKGSLETQQAIDALGLQYQPPTARYRILFVFHGTTAPAAMKSDALESKPAPVK